MGTDLPETVVVNEFWSVTMDEGTERQSIFETEEGEEEEEEGEDEEEDGEEEEDEEEDDRNKRHVYIYTLILIPDRGK